MKTLRCQLKQCRWLFPFLLSAMLSAQAQVHAVGTTQTHGNGIYSPGVDAGDYVYISGQGPRRPDGSLPATYREQVKQALDNIKAIVDSAGLTMEHVVYTQVYLENMSQYEEMDHAFGEYFGKTLPARAVLGVARVPDPPIQINAVAVRDLTGRKAISPPNWRWPNPRPPAYSHTTASLSQAWRGLTPKPARFLTIPQSKSISPSIVCAPCCKRQDSTTRTWCSSILT